MARRSNNKFRFSLNAEQLKNWIAQLRSPTAKKVIGEYSENSLGLSSEDYFEKCRAEGCDVCGCALGQFAFANPEGSFINGATHLYRRVIPRYLCDAVVKLNDEDDVTFAELADWLEANVEPV